MARYSIWWKFTEPVEKGGYDWAELDKVVGAADAAGLNLMLSVVQAPGWALEDLHRQAGPVPRIQLQGLGFEFVDAHARIVALSSPGGASLPVAGLTHWR